MKNEDNSRRDFIKKAVTGTAALSVGGILPAFSAKSYSNIIGANDRIKAGVMGVNGRGRALAKNFASQPNCEVNFISDVDARVMEKCMGVVAEVQKKKPKAVTDFRKTLESKDMDVLVIAAPDHWHAPAAILASQAGKHVYLEKPCSHNPHEGELLVAAQKKHNNVIQMGTQRRSWSNIIEGINELKKGVIGRPYFAKGWYANNRGPIGVGNLTEVPAWLNYDLWQGPAPRVAYKDNVIHYNWHWLWNWGTGEAGNNATHMIDLMRWGLGVEYPVKVVSTGGRYRYQDDWETPDTQVISFDFPNNTSMTWEGRSCNGRTIEGTGAGVMFYGESGSMLLDGENSYKIFDLRNKVLKEVNSETVVDGHDLRDPSQMLDVIHIQNFFDAIRKGTKLNADITDGHQSTLLCHLGNIAIRSGGALTIDPANGHIINNPEAMDLWKRAYEPGWEPVV